MGQVRAFEVKYKYFGILCSTSTITPAEIKNYLSTVQVLLNVYLRLQGRHSLFKIIFGGVIIVLGNKSITTRSFILLSVSVIILSLNDY